MELESWRRVRISFMEITSRVAQQVRRVFDRLRGRTTPTDIEIVERFISFTEQNKLPVYYRDNFGFLSRVTSKWELPYAASHEGSTVDALPLLRYLEATGTRFDLALDVGANVGITTMMLARMSSEVWAFEPDTANRSLLRHHLELNGFNNVRVHSCALGDRNDTAILNLMESAGHHSLGDVQPGKSRGRAQIELRRLDGLLENSGCLRVDFLKIDVEGFEKEVLLGLGHWLSPSCVPRIAFEVSKPCLDALGKDAGEIHDLLLSRGYQVYDLADRPVGVREIREIVHGDLVARSGSLRK